MDSIARLKVVGAADDTGDPDIKKLAKIFAEGLVKNIESELDSKDMTLGTPQIEIKGSGTKEVASVTIPVNLKSGFFKGMLKSASFSVYLGYQTMMACIEGKPIQTISVDWDFEKVNGGQNGWTAQLKYRV